MNPESIFSLCGSVTMIGWLLLIISPLNQNIKKIVNWGVIPFLLCLVYAWLIFGHFGDAEGGFGSLAEVKLLFSDDYTLLAGWIHYLAFDLWVGSWALSNSKKYGIHHLLMIPILLATFMLGPVGLATYFLVRMLYTKTAVHENF
ncbi:MAG: ABA4-like family protein [Saprospiraceae bacterium]